MLYVFLILAAVGHAILWVALVNRLHAIAINRTLMNVLTALCGLAVAAIPLAVFAMFATGALPGGPQKVPGIPAILFWSYAAGCVAVFVVATLQKLWTLSHPERRGAMQANHTTRHDLKSSAAEPLMGRGIPTLLSRLPGNQILDLHVHEKQLAIPRLSQQLVGLRIAHISDLHMSGRIERAYFREMVERVNACRPDLVAITGDLVERNECLDWIPDTLGRLCAPGGVYYVLGNHDLRVDQQRLQLALADAGLIHLGGRTLPLDFQNKPLLLAGNELPWYGPAPNVEPEPSKPSQPLPLRILLAHSPDQFSWAQKHSFDLMLAGHNHGGQVRLPLLGPILAPSLHGTRYASGVFRAGRTVLHVSRGAASLTPIRFYCPPEVAVLVLSAP
jgi:predicted MPP superfamily phosphohydrolase